jgi:uncharacterized protein YceH (UPF0502 family)
MEPETTPAMLEILLDDIETRVLACLIEKERTTPEYYPLSLNALTNACNQKSNRDPVMALDESAVSDALQALKGKHLVWFLSTAGGRVTKYEHNFVARWKFQDHEVAILCELMLRGPQTVGELRTRASRIHEFRDLEEAETTLQGLLERGDGPFVARLPRQPGRKDPRYAHLFAGEPALAEYPPIETPQNAAQAPNRFDRIAALEQNVAALASELAVLRQEFAEFKRAFE